MGTDVVIPSTDFTSLDQRVANQLTNSNWTIQLLNTDLKNGYKSATDSAAFMIAQGSKNVPWPPVPMAWELTPKDENGFQFWQRGKTPVCPAIQRPPDGASTLDPKLPNHVHVLHRNGPPNSPWFTAGMDDSVAGGEEVFSVSDDGVSGFFTKWTAPVGQGWYKYSATPTL